MTSAPLADFSGTDRFQVMSCLGAGGFGVVYEALDRSSGRRVAIKTMRRASGEGLYRLKREFRALADLRHPNLVELYEFLSDGEQWFLTMELIRGQSFLDFVRPGHPAVLSAQPTTESVIASLAPALPLEQAVRTSDGILPALSGLHEERLRGALRQLAEGVVALHGSSQLHRDLKPSNVLVTTDGRVVVLDFGLIAELAPQASAAGLSVVGTPLYMAPEQVEGKPLSEASDWYAVGVMLYEALTGQAPFSGSLAEIVTRKLTADPRPPSEVAAVPTDLDSLCRDLLRRRPEERITTSQILRRLGVGSPEVAALPRASRLLGREAHLATLREALAEVGTGKTVVVRLHGRPGMGKSALVRVFTDEVAARSDAVVVSGRCYEREAVPYKALDSVVDALSAYLKRVPPAEMQALLPRDVPALGRLFPVLQRVEAMSATSRRGSEPVDVHELRRRGFQALRELLSRLADRRVVVVCVDDLQWGDVDSASLLAELLRPPDPPSLLLVASYRSEEAQRSAFLRRFLDENRIGGSVGDSPFAVREIVVGELPIEAARDVAISRLRPDKRSFADLIARESGGHPFFIEELAWAVAHGADLGDQRLTLAEAIRWRARGLVPSAHRLLEVVAVAAGPVETSVIAEAAGLSESADGHLHALRLAHLVRDTRAGDRPGVETYHDRIREVIGETISPESLLETHRALGLALERSGRAEPEALATHFHGGGDFERAARYAAVAAARASEALGFDRAARLYEMALRLRPASDPDVAPLRIKLGEALANAGRGAQAAAAYRVAIDTAPAELNVELRRRVAEQLLASGHVDEGLKAARDVLAAVGLSMATSARGALLSLLMHRAQLWLGGLGFRERTAAEVSPQELVRIDTCWSMAVGLALADTIRGADLQTRSLLLAQKAGEPYRVARGMAMEAAFSAAQGTRRHDRTAGLLAHARQLSARVANPHATSLVHLVAGLSAFLEGHWADALRLLAEAETSLAERCTGVPLELDTVRLYTMNSLFYLGRCDELRQRLSPLLESAMERGDLLMQAYLRSWHVPFVYLCRDEPEAADAALDEVSGLYSQTGFHLQHLIAFLWRGEVAIYAGRASEVWQTLNSQWSYVRGSMQLYPQINLMLLLGQRARVALALASTSREPAQFLRFAERDAKSIDSERTAWGEGLALLARAGIAAIRGSSDHALSGLEAAEQMFRTLDMELYAAVSLRRRGELLADRQGAALIAAADAWMTTQGIRNPVRMTAMLAPGFKSGSEGHETTA